MKIEEINKFVGLKIREYRKLLGLKQEELAKKIGVGKTTISNYEVGIRSPKKPQLIKLAEIFEVSIDDLFPQYNSAIDEETIKDETPIIDKTVQTMKQLEEPRQKVVLKTAESQKSEQDNEKSKIISINKAPDDLPPYISRKLFENFVMPKNTMEYEPDNDLVEIPILGRIAAGLPLDAVENFDGTRPVAASFMSAARDYYWLMVEGHSMEPKIPFGAYVLIEAVPDVVDGEIGAVLFEDDETATLKKIYHENRCLRLVAINKKFKDQFANEDRPAVIIGQAVKIEVDL